MKKQTAYNGRRRILVGGSALLASALARAGSANADRDYPTKPIRLLVPFTPGGVSDGSARLVAEYLGQRLNQTFVVDNRPGASGLVSGQLLAKAEPDGYTIMLGYNGLLAINPHVVRDMPYDTLKAIQPIGKIGEYPSLLCANPALGFKTWSDVAAASRSRAGGLSYGTSGIGGAEHLLGVLLTMRTGANLVHVPYKGAGPAIADAMSGHIPLSLTSLTGGAAPVRDGKLVGIGVSSAKRSPALPQVPTFVEGGIPDLVFNSWIGLFAPGGTPKPIVDKLNGHLNKVLEEPELRNNLDKLGVTATPGETLAFLKEIESDLERYGSIIKVAGIAAQ
jgi:tripartite-type tricarboxylate transporter receptor subunit TctC